MGEERNAGRRGRKRQEGRDVERWERDVRGDEWRGGEERRGDMEKRGGKETRGEKSCVCRRSVCDNV